MKNAKIRITAPVLLALLMILPSFVRAEAPGEGKRTDFFGASAYEWELEEGVRLIMLEAGGEEEADIREHCAVLFKQLRYAQVMGGYDDWGTSLWGIIHGKRTYSQTAPRIWEREAEPTERVRELFFDVWENGYDTDIRVQTYQSRDYADWAIPAYQIGETYYSINPWQDFSAFGY